MKECCNKEYVCVQKNTFYSQCRPKAYPFPKSWPNAMVITSGVLLNRTAWSSSRVHRLGCKLQKFPAETLHGTKSLPASSECKAMALAWHGRSEYKCVQVAAMEHETAKINQSALCLNLPRPQSHKAIAHCRAPFQPPVHVVQHTCRQLSTPAKMIAPFLLQISGRPWQTGLGLHAMQHAHFSVQRRMLTNAAVQARLERRLLGSL